MFVTSAAPGIAYVLPCLNEAQHLRATLASLIGQWDVAVPVEIVVVDGGSTDGSTEIVHDVAASAPSSCIVRLVDNPRRTAAAGFNVGIAQSTAPVVVLGGARTVYPAHHAATVLDVLGNPQIDVAGGGVRNFLPAKDASLERAIAALYVSPVGAGAAAYHRLRTPGFVDTVYCGAYRRSVLDAVGSFDERFTRGQDAEYNSRVTAAGFRILFDPRLSTDYQFRGGIREALRRAFRTGHHNARGWKLQPRTIRLRHLAPICWTMFVLLAPLSPWWKLNAIGLAAYTLTLLVGAIRLLPRLGPQVTVLLLPVFALFHLAYGFGQLRGLFGRT